MKLSKLAKIVKKSGKRITCYTDANGTQWIGSTHGIYPLYSMGKLSAEQILILLDIPYKERKEYEVVDIPESLQGLIDSFSGNLDLSTFIEFRNNNFNIDDIKCFETKYGIKTIMTSDLQVSDIEEDDVQSELYYDFIENLNIIAIAKGLIIVGIIECRDYITEELVQKHRKIYESLSAAWKKKQEYIKEHQATKLDQIEFDSLSDKE